MNEADIPSILKKIVETKKSEVADSKNKTDFKSIVEEAHKLKASNQVPRRGFANALRSKQNEGLPAIIAEIKQASPSKGIISKNFNPSKIASGYEKAGAACLSVLTDEQYFKGHPTYLKQAKDACELPVLRKDFMIDAYQIYESYLMGADCILLIVACLDDDTLLELNQIACKLGMDSLIEVHTQHELERAMRLPQSEHNIYGINNRDLNTFNTDLQTSIKLKRFLNSRSFEGGSLESGSLENVKGDPIQSSLLVTESGIHSSDDIQLMLDHGIDCFLIGEQFMKTNNPGDTLATLLNSI